MRKQGHTLIKWEYFRQILLSCSSETEMNWKVISSTVYKYYQPRFSCFNRGYSYGLTCLCWPKGDFSGSNEACLSSQRFPNLVHPEGPEKNISYKKGVRPKQALVIDQYCVVYICKTLSLEERKYKRLKILLGADVTLDVLGVFSWLQHVKNLWY